MFALTKFEGSLPSLQDTSNDAVFWPSDSFFRALCTNSLTYLLTYLLTYSLLAGERGDYCIREIMIIMQNGTVSSCWRPLDQAN